jgi:tRNA-2-methylthio-N6-dimethylallyladenosine synthase
MRRSFYIKAYGCQMNLYDAGVVKEILENDGYVQVDQENEAEVVLLLTCSVRNHAESRALGRLASLKRKGNGGRIVGILGCMAQNFKETLINQFGADLVVGPDGYRSLPELLNNCLNIHSPQICIRLNEEIYEDIRPKSNGKVTGYVSIMRGCNNFCSYCIVPFVRGRERSKNSDYIIKEIEILSQGGIKDITLVGQNVLAYQNNGLDFCDLIKLVQGIPNIERIHFITAHPKDFNEKVIETLANLRKFCQGIHLPLQSGSNRILEMMNRRYSREEYIEKIELARKLIADVSFTTDIMVGFPTETEEDFLATLDLMQRIRFDFAYMFQYSPRPQTKAINIKPIVEPKIGHKRLERLIEIQNQITKENNQALINKDFEIMIEGHNSIQSIARTRTNKIVIIDKIEPIGRISKAKVIDIRGWTPIGEIKKVE